MKKRIVNFWFVLLTVTVSGQHVSGVVKDEKGKALHQVNVVLENTAYGTTTLWDGTFSIRNLKEGKYIITASHVGYISHSQEFVVAGNSHVRVEMTLITDLLNMPEVIIMAKSDIHSEMINIPVRTVVLETEDIQKIPAISAGGLFTGISGVNVNSEFGIFSSSSVSLRGVGGNSQTGTLVVLDGLPLNKADGGSVNWNIIDKDKIEKIEIIKGPGSVLFGSNAMGGIINIISLQAVDKLKGNVSLSYGTYNTFEAKSHWSGSSKNRFFYWKTFVNFRESDGYINTPEEIIAENDTIVVPVFLKEFFAGGMMGVRIDKYNSIELSANYFDDQRGRGTKIYEEYGSNTERGTYQAFLKYKGQIGTWKTFANVYGFRENYFRLNEYFSDGEYKLYEVDSKRDDFGLRLRTDKQLNERTDMIVGGEVKTGRVEAADIYYTSTDLISNSGSMDIYSLFIQYRVLFKNFKWTIIGGLRYDIADFHNAAFSIEKPSYSIEYFSDFQFDQVQSQQWGALSPKFTIQFSPKQDSRYFLTIAKGFRAPVLDDLCRSERTQRGLRVANPELKSEQILSAEFGTDQILLNFLKAELSIYHTIGYDFMYLLSTGDSVNLGFTVAPVFHMSNISRMNITGAELDVSLPIGKNFTAWANYTVNRAQIGQYEARSDADIDLSGKFLANLPMHRYSAGASLKTNAVNFSVAGNFTGKRWVRDDNLVDNIYFMTDQYPSYFTVDVKLWKEFRNFEAGLNVDNLFNVLYTNNRGYRSPGRMMFLKLAYTINKT